MEQYGKHGGGPRDRRVHGGGRRHHGPFKGGGTDGFRGGRGGGGRRNDPPPGFIPSPYNFAPISEKVCEIEAGETPWADVPFSDGLSGHIRLRVTAMTPIFIRGPGKHPEKADQKRSSEAHQTFFRLPDGRFAIPGTSIKGMLRNVLEIATFSRMTHVDNKRYGFRDLNNDDPDFYRGWMSETDKRSGAYRPKARAGWLTRGECGKWLLQPCEFARVDHSLLEGVPPLTPFSQRQQARDRYKAWCDIGKKSLEVKFDANPPAAHKHTSSLLWYAEVTSLRGKTPGTLVFTGQPMPRDSSGVRVPRRKHMEFVFFDDPGSTYPKGPHPVLEEVMDDFKFIHEDSEDWKWWQARLKKGEVTRIPVFYLAFDGEPKADKPTAAFGPGKTLHSLGLAMMYRLAHHKRIRDALPEAHRKPSRDSLPIAEAIFGRVEVEGHAALRGRIVAEPFPAREGVRILDVRDEVLNCPKPTFYPNYIQQKTDASGDHLAGGHYSTLQNEDARIRGWKRYPVPGDGAAPRANPSPNDNRDVCTYFRPLDRGAGFEGYLRFHNLRPWELGALIWAITFGDPTNDRYRHSLGMAKPLGYGSVRIEIDSDAAEVRDFLNQSKSFDPDNWLGDFRAKMAELWGGDGWEGEAPIQELRLMARQDAGPDPARMRYPRDVKEFAGFKKTAPPLVLPPYSKIAGRGRSSPNTPGAPRPGQAKVGPSGGTRHAANPGGGHIRQVREFVFLGRFKQGKEVPDGNPRFKLVGGGPSDIGYLQAAPDRDRFPRDAKPGEWVGNFVVNGMSPGNWALAWPSVSSPTPPKT